MDLHPIVARAAEGQLPPWAEATPQRRSHMARVAELLDTWGRAGGVPEAERRRLRAVGWLHDALRDADPEALRSAVPAGMEDLPGRILHGPAVAERLRREGVADDDLLQAVAYHTLGHAALGDLGRSLYLADFLEPGRDLLNEWRASLRERMPGEGGAVLRAVLGARIVHLVERGGRLRPETVAFWNAQAVAD